MVKSSDNNESILLLLAEDQNTSKALSNDEVNLAQISAGDNGYRLMEYVSLSGLLLITLIS